MITREELERHRPKNWSAAMTTVVPLAKSKTKQSFAVKAGLYLGERPSISGPAPAATVEPILRLCLFGRTSLWAGKREIAIKCRKGMALVAYLALTPGMKETRDRLAGLLWSEKEATKARASLRQTLHMVRVALQKEQLSDVLIDKTEVGLDSTMFVTDLDDALTSIERGDPAPFLMNDARMTDILLSECDHLDPSYGDWLRCKRESVRQQLVRGLEERLSDHTPTTAAKRIAHALFQLDPTSETACQALMRAFMDLGNTGSALAVYKQLWSRLEEQFDVEPSTGTQSLAVAIKCGAYGAA
jgi:DNA-binding SARP family transcriptional activator